MVGIIILSFYIIYNIGILKSNKNLVKSNEIILYEIYPKNGWNIFILIVLILNLLYGFIESTVINKINTFYFGKSENIFIILHIIMFIECVIGILTNILLYFVKNVIIDNTIYLNNGIFDMENIKNVKKYKNNYIRIYVKNKTGYAIFGYKEFKVNENERENIFEYINKKIVTG